MAHKEYESRKEPMRAAATVGVFIKDHAGNILLVQEATGRENKWSPVYGFVNIEDHEFPHQAAIREVKEETGLDVQLTNLLGIFHYYDDLDRLQTAYAYEATITGGGLNLQTEEIQQALFFRPEQIHELFMQNNIRVPHINRTSFNLWKQGNRYPLSLVQNVDYSLVDRYKPARKSPVLQDSV
ncbi:MAG: NUDIX hydrolase [Patescibacteria group bacterium]